jgi:hypothetical protein
VYTSCPTLFILDAEQTTGELHRKEADMVPAKPCYEEHPAMLRHEDVRRAGLAIHAGYHGLAINVQTH